MKKEKIILSFLTYISVFSIVFAQHPSCDGDRYINYYFPEVDSAINIQFGQN